ncbi:methyl-accepting chemotaxis protein, partial [Acinetobacter baumannii]|uniref:hypothetical protein n=1 Tax=Acinetobacter baumannii TaxID=470 RepID=UPI00288F67D2
YKAGQDTIIGHVAAGDAEAARTLLGKDLRPLLVRLKAATAEQTALQNEIADAAARDAETTYRNTSAMMWAFGAAALALAALVAWWI